MPCLRSAEETQERDKFDVAEPEDGVDLPPLRVVELPETHDVAEPEVTPLAEGDPRPSGEMSTLDAGDSTAHWVGGNSIGENSYKKSYRF